MNDKYAAIRNMTKEDREEIFQFAMKRSQDMLLEEDDDSESGSEVCRRYWEGLNRD